MQLAGLTGRQSMAVWMTNPETVERAVLYSSLALSSLLLSRRFTGRSRRRRSSKEADSDSLQLQQAAPPQPPKQGEKAGGLACCRRFFSHFLFPCSWLYGALPVYLMLSLSYFFFMAFTLSPHVVLAVPTLLFFFLAFAAIIRLWLITVPHPIAAQPAAMTGEDGLPCPSPLRSWRARALLLLCLLVIALPNIRYQFVGFCAPNSFCSAFGTEYMRSIFLAALPLLAVLGCCLLYADRELIRRGERVEELSYFLIVLAFHVRLPHLMYEGWNMMFLRFYNSCGATLLSRTLWMLGFHAVFACCQTLIRVLGLLVFVPEHGLAMVFYLQVRAQRFGQTARGCSWL